MQVPVRYLKAVRVTSTSVLHLEDLIPNNTLDVQLVLYVQGGDDCTVAVTRTLTVNSHPDPDFNGGYDTPVLDASPVTTGQVVEVSFGDVFGESVVHDLEIVTVGAETLVLLEITGRQETSIMPANLEVLS